MLVNAGLMQVVLYNGRKMAVAAAAAAVVY